MTTGPARALLRRLGDARVWAQLRAAVPIRSGILALDDTGFPKQGTQSPSVQQQYGGVLGKIGNCQVAVSSALIADHFEGARILAGRINECGMSPPDKGRKVEGQFHWCVSSPASIRVSHRWHTGTLGATRAECLRR